VLIFLIFNLLLTEMSMDFFLNYNHCWLDSGVMDLPDEVIERKFHMLQLEINHPLQNQISGSCSSSGFNQLESPRVPTTHTSVNPQHEKKRKADREYRGRQKEGKKKLKSDFEKICAENMKLKTENENLERGRDETKNELESTLNEAKTMKGEIFKFKNKIKSQEIFVEDYSQKILNVGHQREQEVRDWKNKINAISSYWEDWNMIEKEQLIRKVADLEREKKLLEVQVQVLCSRIMETNDSEDT
jgi:chromosome segregation ATPase